MNAPTLGEPRFPSRAGRHAVSDDIRIPEHIEARRRPGLQFELAGPRAKLFFDGKNTRAGIVTCGGLCPGLNNVIRSLFLELHYGYGVVKCSDFAAVIRASTRSAELSQSGSRRSLWTAFTSKVGRCSVHRAGPSMFVARSITSSRADKHSLHRRWRRHAAWRERSLPGSSQTWARTRRGGSAKDDRQRCRLRLADLRLL